MPSKGDYILEARHMYHEPKVFEISTDATVEYERDKNDKIVGAYVSCRIFLLADDAERDAPEKGEKPRKYSI